MVKLQLEDNREHINKLLEDNREHLDGIQESIVQGILKGVGQGIAKEVGQVCSSECMKAVNAIFEATNSAPAAAAANQTGSDKLQGFSFVCDGEGTTWDLPSPEDVNPCTSINSVISSVGVPAWEFFLRVYLETAIGHCTSNFRLKLHTPNVVVLKKGDVIDRELIQKQLGEATSDSILLLLLVKMDDVCHPFLMLKPLLDTGVILRLNDECSLADQDLECMYKFFFGKAFDMNDDHEFKHLKGTVEMKKFVRNYNQCLGRDVNTTKFDVTIKEPVVALFKFLQYVAVDVCGQTDLTSVIVDKLDSMELKYLPIALYAVVFKVLHELHASKNGDLQTWDNALMEKKMILVYLDYLSDCVNQTGVFEGEFVSFRES